MTTFSACIEMLYVPETDDIAERMRMAARSGFTAVEFWWWTNKDLDAIEKAQRETGLKVTGMVAEPMIPLVDPSTHDRFLEGLKDSIAVAQRFGAGVLIAQTGDDQPGKSRREQRAALVSVLSRAADVLKGTGVVLAVEPLNTLIDHKGYYLSSTVEGLDIIDEVGREEIRILYDVYHSLVMGEVTADVLAGRVDRVAHIHIADHFGRNEPGSGGLDLRAALSWIKEHGYTGPAGLEFRPTFATEAAVDQTLAYFEGV